MKEFIEKIIEAPLALFTCAILALCALAPNASAQTNGWFFGTTNFVTANTSNLVAAPSAWLPIAHGQGVALNTQSSAVAGALGSNVVTTIQGTCDLPPYTNTAGNIATITNANQGVTNCGAVLVLTPAQLENLNAIRVGYFQHLNATNGTTNNVEFNILNPPK